MEPTKRGALTHLNSYLASGRQGTEFKKSSNRSSHGVFLTETQFEEERPVPVQAFPAESSIEDLIWAVDDMISGARYGNDELAELRARINRCGVGISKQSVVSKGLNKEARDLKSRVRSMENQLQSCPRLDKHKRR